MENSLKILLTQRRQFWQYYLDSGLGAATMITSKLTVMVCEHGEVEWKRDETISKEIQVSELHHVPVLSLGHTEIKFSNLKVHSVAYYPGINELVVWAERLPQ